MINSLSARANARVSLRACRQFLFGLALALGFGLLAPVSSSAGPGDSSPTGIVANEIARRQELVDQAKLNIIDADKLVDQGQLAPAIEKYYSAYSTTDTSALALPVHTLARSRFASISVIYARELAHAARYDEANRVLDRVLEPSMAPDHKSAKRLKSDLADPERYNPALSPGHLKAVKKVDDLFQLAEGHMKLGNFDMANLTYASILREDPTNEAARRGMEAADLQISQYHDSSRDHFRSKALAAIDGMWEFGVPLPTRGFEGALDLPGSVNSSAITDRLRNIIVPEIEFTEESLTGVAEYLTRISKDLDPTGVGVNFVLQLGPDDAHLRDTSVNLILRAVPLGEVVRFVTHSTNTKFRVDQFAVVITSLNSASTALVTKTFYVPPDFLNSLPDDAAAGGGFDDPFGDSGGAKKSNLITQRLNAKTYLERSGVPFPDGAFATHTVSNNTLIVHNTQNNIDLIETLVANLNKAVKQLVVISVKQVELDVGENNELTFDHLLGMFNIPGSSSVFGSGAGNDQLPSDFAFTPPGSDVPVGQNALTKGIRSGDFAIRDNPINSVTDGEAVSDSSSSKASSMFGISSIFGDPQYQLAIRAINQQKTASVTNSPSTVTQPGQRSVIEVIRAFPYPTEYDPPEIPQTFTQSRQNSILIDPVNQVLFFIPGQDPPNTFPVTPAHPTAFDVRNVGTRLEVEPTIDPNGYLVTLNLSVEFSQFEGFINYGTPIATSDGVVLTDNRILQPLFKVSRLAQPVHVQDGSNFVIGGIMNDDVTMTEDKVPFLGDVPVVGRLFRGKVQKRRRKAILFFVHVRLITPGGEPVNQAIGSEEL